MRVANRSADRRSTRLPVEAPLLPILFGPAVVAVVALDSEGLVTGANPQTEQLLGYREEELVGVRLHDLVHYQTVSGEPLPARDCPILQAVTEARTTARDADVVFHRDGHQVPVSWVAAPVVLAGEVTGGVLAIRDGARPAEDLRLAEFGALSAEHARLALLAEATHVLTSEFDVRQQLRALARLVVPRLADWTVIEVLDAQGRVERAVVEHRSASEAGREPDALAALEGVLPPLVPGARGSLARALRGAGTQLVHDFAVPPDCDELTAAQYGLFTALGASAAIVAPLPYRGRVVGALTTVRTRRADRQRWDYDEDDVDLVTDLARRAGLAIGNTWLLDQHRQVAEALQRSLFSELPQLGAISLTARYQPARETVRVGGDWYDAVRRPDGSLALTIGDVMGHDVTAAGRMAQLNTMVRMAALDRSRGPGEILDAVDAAMTEFGIDDDLTTLFHGHLEGPGLQHDASSWQLRWSNAGHPPPILVLPDGGTVLVDTRHGPVLGVGGTHQTVVTPLPEAFQVLLYTDGLVESRTESIDSGIGALRALLARHHRSRPDELLEAISPRAGRHEDDIAVLLVRRDAA